MRCSITCHYAKAPPGLVMTLLKGASRCFVTWQAPAPLERSDGFARPKHAGTEFASSERC